MNIEYRDLTTKVIRKGQSEYDVIINALKKLPDGKQLSFNYKDSSDYKNYPIHDLTAFSQKLKHVMNKAFGIGVYRIQTSRQTGEIIIRKIEVE